MTSTRVKGWSTRTAVVRLWSRTMRPSVKPTILWRRSSGRLTRRSLAVRVWIVEEGDLAGIVRADRVTIVERDVPAERAEVRATQGGVARGGRAGAPAGVDNAEGDVVHHVPGQHPRPDEVDHVGGQRRPAGYQRRRRALASGERGNGWTFPLPSRRRSPGRRLSPHSATPIPQIRRAACVALLCPDLSQSASDVDSDCTLDGKPERLGERHMRD